MDVPREDAGDSDGGLMRLHVANVRQTRGLRASAGRSRCDFLQMTVPEGVVIGLVNGFTRLPQAAR
ncbi:hypothetical protein XarbCFBP8142_13135 [Xanthomonas arboricola]|nr:hypothetical protein XarbCFBP8142_13135 [Xanthomonas arboricola]PPU19243.1 hypothetical protein XarbCFBP7610_11250 [Xanthomonas arboricola]